MKRNYHFSNLRVEVGTWGKNWQNVSLPWKREKSLENSPQACRWSHFAQKSRETLSASTTELDVINKSVEITNFEITEKRWFKKKNQSMDNPYLSLLDSKQLIHFNMWFTDLRPYNTYERQVHGDRRSNKVGWLVEFSVSEPTNWQIIVHVRSRRCLA